MRPAHRALIEALVDKIARGMIKRKGATKVGATKYLNKISGNNFYGSEGVMNAREAMRRSPKSSSPFGWDKRK